jgi:UDP-N-acetylmuramoylalanine--D-glutamate ligase
MALVARKHDWAEHHERSRVVATVGANRTLIVGLGTTGLAVARYLAARHEAALVIDSRAAPPGLRELRESHPETAVVLESLDAHWLEGIDRVVLSPGLGVDIPLIAAARARGIPVWSEVELFARAALAPVIAVTGSNGKSTVVTLTAEILAAQGFRAPRGGNLGPPALELLSEGRADAYVLEISSFQMETTASLRPLSAAVLNVSADHLDRHGSLERYAELKEAVLAQAATAVVNWDDPRVRAMGARHGNTIPFSVREPLERGYSVVNRHGARWLAKDREPLMPAAELALHGPLGEANSLAALALCAALDGELEPALRVLQTFPGLPHRCRKVSERRGVAYVNDSKGTNVGATVAALQGIAGPVVLIAGGVGKGASFEPLTELPSGRLRAAVLIGQAAAELEATLSGTCPAYRARTMAEAVERAADIALPGDTVLLSPACASQDMFADYRERGDVFTRAVLELPA